MKERVKEHKEFNTVYSYRPKYSVINGQHFVLYLTLCILEPPKMVTFANSEYPEEIHQDLHCLL